MKKEVLKRSLSVFLAFLMVAMVLPLNIFATTATTASTQTIGDYTPFLIESINGEAVYNAQTAEMCFELQIEAENYVIDNAKESLNPISDNTFKFSYGGNTYYLSSTYISDPAKQSKVDAFLDSTCGFLIGMLNYVDINGTNKHVMLVSFAGTQKNLGDITTDFAYLPEKVDSDHWYHNGFYEAAKSHYNSVKNTSFSMGNGQTYTFDEYVDKLAENGNDYQMIITGHSLGAAVANIFTSYFVDTLGGEDVQKNAIAYTFATPLTSSDGTANRSNVDNVFNYINRYDWVPDVGYGAVEHYLLPMQGAREGLDLTYTAGTFYTLPLNFSLHKMKPAVYGKILADANANIANHIDTFVLYNNYDASTNEYQRIIYNDGHLLVSGNGTLAGDWRENTLIDDFAMVKDDCISLTFTDDCQITAIGDSAFSGMTSLQQLNLPDTLESIGNEAFYNCSGLTGTLTLKNIPVGDRAFYGCTGFSKIDATAITDINYIGFAAFSGCKVTFNPALLKRYVADDDMTDYYYYEHHNMISKISTIKYSYENGIDATTNQIEQGSTIYFRRHLDTYLNAYGTEDYDYYLVNGNMLVTSDTVPTDINNYIYQNGVIGDNYVKLYSTGVVDISQSCPEDTVFFVFAFRKGVPVNSQGLKFKVRFIVKNGSSAFAGGYGTQDRPYLVSTPKQLQEVCKYGEGTYFRLLNDISGETITEPLGTLKGSLDGNGYSIYNFEFSKPYVSGNTIYCGLFIEIAEGAEVKNLTIGKDDEDYTTKVMHMNLDAKRSYYGSLAAINSGTITNCYAENVYWYISLYYSGSGRKYAATGGLVGKNTGSIDNCGVYNSYIFAWAQNKQNYANAYAIAGGICGQATSGTISNCFSFNNTIRAGGHALTDEKWYAEDDTSSAHVYVGGIIGGGVWETNENSVTGSGMKVGKNTLLTEATAETEDCTNQKRAFFGADFNGITKGKSTITELPSMEESIRIEYEPYKTDYFVGDVFNLSGIQIANDDERDLQGYTVTGFDSAIPGEKTITVKYHDATTTFRVNVHEKSVVAIEITSKPKTQYKFGEALNKDITVSAYYSDGSVVEELTLQDGVTVSDVSLTSTGSIPVAVTYAGQTDSYLVTVTCDHKETSLENQLVASCAEYGYSGDTVCTACGSVMAEGNLIDIHTWESDCDTACNECGEVRETETAHVWSSDCDTACNNCGGARETATDHTWDGIYDSICNHCGYMREPETEHTWSSDCDTACNTCGYIRKVEVEHTYPEKRTHNETTHWYVCTACGEKLDETEHTFAHACDPNCNPCGYVRDVSDLHIYAENMLNSETSHWYDCVNCTERKDEAAHVYASDCDTTCDTCGYVRTVEVAHSASETLSRDETSHWYLCTNCGEKTGETEHTFVHACDPNCNPCGYVRDISDLHIYAESMLNSETSHWYDCVNCTERKDEAEHVYDSDCDTTCNTCGYVRETEAEHSYSEKRTHDEASHWYVCTACGEKLDETEHVFAHACDPNCDPCGYVRDVSDLHVYKETLKSDATSHWYPCETCGAKKDEAEHVYAHPCDPDCSVCYATRDVSDLHIYKDTLKSDIASHWYPCENCKARKDEAAHIYNADCDATCTVCISMREVEVEHVYSEIPDHDEASHWYLCSGCGVKLVMSEHIYAHPCDPNCDTCGYIRDVSDLHIYQSTLKSNETSHWYPCENCTEKKDEEAHIYDSDCDTICNTCGYVRATEAEHSYPEKRTHDEASHWYVCTSCGEKVDETEHTFAHPCDPNCNLCGYVRDVSDLHVYKETLKSDETSHWYACEYCGAKKDEAEHVYAHPCDPDCSVCYATRDVSDLHIYKDTLKSDIDSHWYPCENCTAKKDVASHIYDNDSDTDCNDCGAVKPAYTPGDLDGKEGIDKDDAIYLLMHSFFPEVYPVDQPCDYTGDGAVDKDDAIYLLMHSFFPEVYPIAAPVSTASIVSSDSREEEE